MIIPKLRPLFDRAAEGFSRDHAPRHAASVAFYAMLSLSPLLVLAVAIAGRFAGEDAVRAAVLKEATAALGKPAGEFVGSLIRDVAEPGKGVVATVISIGLALFGASNLFGQLSDSVSYIWKVKAPESGIKTLLLGKFISVLMFVSFLVVFMSWLILDSWLGWAGRHVGGFNGWQVVSLLVSTVFLTVVFAFAFKALPRRVVDWCDVWIAAAVTAIGIALSKLILSLYFAYSGVSAAYGSAGALVVVLLWVYYSAQIYFFGIELTCAYAHMHGSQRNREKNEPPMPVPQS